MELISKSPKQNLSKTAFLLWRKTFDINIYHCSHPSSPFPGTQNLLFYDKNNGFMES